MEQRQIKELYIRVKDSKGEEAWLSMTEFSKVFMETVGKAINLTFQNIGEEIKNLSNSSSANAESPNKDLTAQSVSPKVCPCHDGNHSECPICKEHTNLEDGCVCINKDKPSLNPNN